MRNSAWALALVLAPVTLHATGFEVKYVGTDRLKWSQHFPPTTNGCVNASGAYDASKCTYRRDTLGEPIEVDHYPILVVEDSAAARICAQIGGRLPTEIEYERLIRQFEHVQTAHGPKLTRDGEIRMRAEMGDMPGTIMHDGGHCAYWTASLRPGHPNEAWIFDCYEFGSTGLYFERKWPYFSVRCVMDP